MKEGFYYLPESLPSTPEPTQDQKAWGDTRVVGRGLPRIDGYERLSGSAIYPSDVSLPGMLYGAILRCPHPRARVRSIDITKAEAMPGVVAVISSDTPGANRPWYRSQGQTVGQLFETDCRFQGEVIAAVAAETPFIAWDAVRAIEVDFKILPFTVDEREAMDADAPEVRDGGNQATPPQIYERGNILDGFAEADIVLEEQYHTECQLHTTMETHGSVVRWEGNKLTVWESTQGVYGVQSRLAQVLDLPLSSVRVIGHYVGGGFGSKLGTTKSTVVAALLARRAARPVKLFLTREETLLCVGNRPANQMRVKAGIKNDGTLTALEFEGTGSGGAYSSSGTGALDWQVRDLYRCSNVKTVRHNIYLNTGEQRPMRAPGHPQCSWALEQMMDSLAQKAGLDPVEFRLRNLSEVSQGRGNIPYTTNGFRQCLEDGAREFGWQSARNQKSSDESLRRGVGVAGAVWVAGAGGPPSTAIVKYFADGSANLNIGASDIGTGTKTVMAMVVSEELGIPVERIQVENADTGTTQYATGSGGSKTVPTESPAVRAAALDCRDQLLSLASEELEVEASDLVLSDGEIRSRRDDSKKVAVRNLKGFRRTGIIVGVGYRAPNPQGKAICPFAAQFCEVEVNMRTGEVRVLRFLGAHDSGRVLNRKTYDNQVYGGVVMGIGFGMTERRVLDRNQTGKMVNLNFHDYKVPTSLDVPAEMVSLPIEIPDEEANSTGTKGLGEPVTIPTAAAVANAVYDATGIRVTRTPINPTQLLDLIGAGPRETDEMSGGRD